MGSAKHGDITQGYGAIGTPLCWTHGTHKGSNNGTSLHKSGDTFCGMFFFEDDTR